MGPGCSIAVDLPAARSPEPPPLFSRPGQRPRRVSGVGRPGRSCLSLTTSVHSRRDARLSRVAGTYRSGGSSCITLGILRAAVRALGPRPSPRPGGADRLQSSVLFLLHRIGCGNLLPHRAVIVSGDGAVLIDAVAGRSGVATRVRKPFGLTCSRPSSGAARRAHTSAPAAVGADPARSGPSTSLADGGVTGGAWVRSSGAPTGEELAIAGAASLCVDRHPTFHL